MASVGSRKSQVGKGRQGGAKGREKKGQMMAKGER